MVEVTTFQPMVHCFVNTSVATKKTIGFQSMNFPELISLPRINGKMQKIKVHQVIPIPMYRVFLWGEEDKKFKVELKQRHVIVHLKDRIVETA